MHGLTFLNIAQDLKLTVPVKPLTLRPEEFQPVPTRPLSRHITREALQI